MASESFSVDDFSCAVCCEICKDPVIFLCSHIVCKLCVEELRNTIGFKECPVCGKRSLHDHHTVLERRGETFCSLHLSELKLLCEDDNQLVCLVCPYSKFHKNHHFSPISEAALALKDELMDKLKALQQSLDTFKKALTTCNETAQHIKLQTQHTEEQIKQEFESLHQCLRDEQAARIAALREEEEQKCLMMKEKTDKMRREISNISDTIKTIQEEMGADDAAFLQNYKTTLERARSAQQEPKNVSGALINVAKHLGNLRFRVWEKMLENLKYNPVILDPNTAHPYLILSQDLTSVRFRDKIQRLPDNPERFEQSASVLASEGFTSGTHFWDVDLERSKLWIVGVMRESGQRNGESPSFRSEVWGMALFHGKYRALAPSQPLTPIAVQKKLQRIRVQLDYNRGQLSFSDPDNNTHLHTCTHTFSGRVFPYFLVDSPLRIVPVEAVVSVELLS